MTACEIKPRYHRALKVGALQAGALALLGALSAAASPAQAVDLVNRDKASHDVTVNSSDGLSKVITVKAGQKVADICSDCVILVGRTSVETKGRATVKIEGGEVSIASQR